MLSSSLNSCLLHPVITITTNQFNGHLTRLTTEEIPFHFHSKEARNEGKVNLRIQRERETFLSRWAMCCIVFCEVKMGERMEKKKSLEFNKIWAISGNNEWQSSISSSLHREERFASTSMLPGISSPPPPQCPNEGVELLLNFESLRYNLHVSKISEFNHKLDL